MLVINSKENVQWDVHKEPQMRQKLSIHDVSCECAAILKQSIIYYFITYCLFKISLVTIYRVSHISDSNATITFGSCCVIMKLFSY